MSCNLVLPPEGEELCNTQHASSECYLRRPSDLLAISINDFTIRLLIYFPDTMDNVPDSLRIQRDDPGGNTLLFTALYDSLDLQYTDTTIINSDTTLNNSF